MKDRQHPESPEGFEATLPTSGEHPIEEAPHASYGRYEILRLLGTGAVGTVYAARDLELERDVALKVLSADVIEPGHARSLLLREARALAQLDHPNVIRVYDIGETPKKEYFIALELVEGTTLQGWLAASARSQREILRAFVQAACGLQAAHARGLVHRDFKPANVMVGSDGRVRVGDFGLVVHADRPAAPSGRLVGTPAYMAPEQLQGEKVDARSDQFAFFVCLYEALYGQRPFTASSLEDQLALMLAPLELPERPKLPPQLGRLLRRGLAPGPADRWPQMAQVHRELERIVDPPWRRRAAIGASIGLAAVLAAGTSLLLTGQDPCSGAPEAVARVWNEDRRTTLGAKLAAAAPGHGGADAVLEVVSTRLRDWGQSYRDACHLTRVAEERSGRVLDLRMECLDRRLRELDSLMAIWEGVGVPAPHQALDSLFALPEVSECSDARALALAANPAFEEEASSSPAVQRVVELLATGRAELVANRLEEADRLGGEAQRLATSANLPRLEAESLLLLGEIDIERGQWESAAARLRRGALTAEAARHDAAAARAWNALVFVAGARLSKPEYAHQLVEHADVSVRRLGEDPALRGELLHNMAVLEVLRADQEAARELYQRSLALRERALGPDHPRIANTLNNLSTTLRLLGRTDESLAANARALAIRRQVFGDAHPLVVSSQFNEALTLMAAERHAEALAGLEAALTLARRVFSPDHPRLVVLTVGYAVGLVQVGRHVEGEALLRPALAEFEARMGATHPDFPGHLVQLSKALRGQGKLQEAEATASRAVELTRTKLGPEHPAVFRHQLELAEVLRRAGKVEQSRRLHGRAVEVFRASGDLSLPEALLGLARDHLAAREPKKALPLLAEARTLAEQRPYARRLSAQLRFALAQAIAQGAPERKDEALGLAASAVDELTRTSADPLELGVITAWISTGAAAER